MAHYLTKRGQKLNNIKRVDWLKRQGTVVRISPVTDSIGVQWDDRASVDQWPTHALEKL